MRAWALLAAAVLPIACGSGPEPGPPASRDTISLEDPAPTDVGVVEEVDVDARDPVERDTVAADAQPDTAVADSAAEAAGSWTAAAVDLPSGDAGASTLASVRAARHEGFDRVVWELEGPIPGVRVEYVDEPVRACGSGEPVPLPGDAWLEVRMTPTNAHTEAGRPTIAVRRRATDLPVVLEIVQTCDFEAVVTWVLAARSPERFRLARLEHPSRLVVDVRHPR